MFVRNFNAHLSSASVDDLMENYDAEANKPLPAPPRDRTPRRRSRSQPPEKRAQSKGLTHHANADISCNTTPLPVEGKSSGSFFRFGKSMAATFNPLNLFSKVTNTWRETKEEMIYEAKEKKELEDRQRLAEQTYAEMKAAGQFGSQVSKPVADNTKIPASKYHGMEQPSQRDSGIAMNSDSARSSMDILSRPPVIPHPGFDSHRKPSLGHIRTSSFHDLRKVISKVDLHKRSVSSSRSRSPEKDFAGGELRRSQSKKDLQKQVKLSRRVSDLESKLEAARTELQNAVAVPPLPSTSHATPRANRQSGTWKRYAPALPTLLSERLLYTENFEEHGNERDDGEMFANAVNNAQERPKTRGFSGDYLYQQPNRPLTATFEFAPMSQHEFKVESVETPLQLVSPVSEPSKADSAWPVKLPESTANKAITRTRTSSEDQLYKPGNDNGDNDSELPPSKIKASRRSRGSEAIAPAKLGKDKTARDDSVGIEIVSGNESVDEDTKLGPGPESVAENSIRENAKADGRKKLKKPVSTTASPKPQKKKNTSIIDDDSDQEDSNPKKSKKRGPVDENISPRSQKIKAARTSMTSSLAKKGNVLTKSKPLPKAPVALPEETVLSQSALETVHEEFTITSTVSLKGDPTKPTARATPAHPGHQHSRSRSGSPMKSPLSNLAFSAPALPYTNRDALSISSPPSSAFGRMMRKPSPDIVVFAKPGEKDVPPMPGFATKHAEEETAKEDYEWDEDIF
jgi:hypothetical protein